MTQLDHEICIAAPPQKVWAVLADLEAVQHYNSGVKHAEYTTALREGVGAGRHCDLKPKGWVKERVIAWEPQQAVTMELYESQWPLEFMRWRTAVTPEGTGTRVTQKMEYQVKFGLLGRMLDKFVMRRKLDQTLTEVFVSLKQFIEKSS
ncbi:MAG: SRPBCC family protein [Gammaproteobacteria bacterium]|nr:SRPBCC family protein [Gammaproteobacteria bacterium]